MTENEALKLIKSLVIDPKCELVKTFDFKATVIKALEDLQQYRAIGTVERFEQLSKQFAPHNVDETSCHLRQCNKCDMYRKENEKYHAIGTIEDFKALKEKEERFDRNIKMFNEIGLEIRNKVIDEFLKKICQKYTEEENKGNYKQYCASIKQEIADMAEQLKGVKNVK